MDPTEKMLTEYDSNCPRYEQFADYLEQLIIQLTSTHGLKVQKVATRIKSRKSVEEKLCRPGKDYQALAEMTDIVGIRVIVYLERDVEKIAVLVRKEFSVDEARTNDKRFTSDPTRFGYQSLNLVIGLSTIRGQLTENAKYGGLVAELQIPTVLQHAWSEIEHDLGYKSAISVPMTMLRQFAQLSALLEVADNQFQRLTDNLATYARQARRRLVSGESVTLDAITLLSYLGNNETVEEIQRALYGQVVSNDEASKRSDWIDIRLRALRDVEIKTTSELHSGLHRYKDAIIALERFLIPDGRRHPDHSLRYLRTLAFVVAALEMPNEVALLVVRRWTLGQMANDGRFDVGTRNQLEDFRSVLQPFRLSRS